jgi:predicted nucleotidyltransferase
MKDIPPRFSKGVEAVQALSTDPRCEAAFIFGSVAVGTATDKSDLDVKVIVDEDNPCTNINHPTFDDYKLDITFRSFPQIKEFTEDEIKRGEREPNLLRGVILFDKTGELTTLQDEIKNTNPTKYEPRDYQFVQFMLYHANNKVERALDNDPQSSLYSMHANIGEVLKIHFKLNGKWWVSSKNVLISLTEWDRELAEVVQDFVSTAEPEEKFNFWTKIVDHVAAKMGGRQPISENNCTCEVCAIDLAKLNR